MWFQTYKQLQNLNSSLESMDGETDRPNTRDQRKDGQTDRQTHTHTYILVMVMAYTGRKEMGGLVRFPERIEGPTELVGPDLCIHTHYVWNIRGETMTHTYER